MSRFPIKIAAPLSLFALAGCMYPPMYQQGPYGQQMYGPQGNFAPSGTLVVPPSNAPLFQPGGSTYSSPGITPSQADDFKKPAADGGRYFTPPDDKVPLPSDAGTGSGTGAESGTRAFSSDLDGSP